MLFLRAILGIIGFGVLALIGYCLYNTAEQKTKEAEAEGNKFKKGFWTVVGIIGILIACALAPKP